MRGQSEDRWRQETAAQTRSLRLDAQLEMGDCACAGHTSNMWLMSVTLDVSKLSEWLLLLNAAAPCGIEKGGS